MKELERKIAQIFIDGIMDAEMKEPDDYQVWARQYSKTILTLIREAGYRSPEEVDDIILRLIKRENKKGEP